MCLLFARFKPREVIGIAPLVLAYRLLVDLHDMGTDRIEEPAIVGNKDNGRRPGQKGILKPLDGVHIEVIGRFVEKDKVALRSKGSRKSYLFDHAPGKRAHGPFEFDNAQFLQKGGKALFEGKTAALLHLVREAGKLAVFGILELRERAFVITYESKEGVVAAVEEVANGISLVEAGLLIQNAHDDVPLAGDGPSVGTVSTGEESEQGGLATAVGAHKPYTLTLLYAGRYPRKKGTLIYRTRDIGKGYQFIAIAHRGGQYRNQPFFPDGTQEIGQRGP